MTANNCKEACNFQPDCAFWSYHEEKELCVFKSEFGKFCGHKLWPICTFYVIFPLYSCVHNHGLGWIRTKDLKVTSGSRTHRSDQSPQFDQIKWPNPTTEDFEDFFQPEDFSQSNPFWSFYRTPYPLIEDPESDEILSLGDSRCSSHWIQTNLEGADLLC